MDVAVIAGSKSDKKFVEGLLRILDDFGVDYDFKILSAHRTPCELVEYLREAESKGVKVFIALAGYAAHLPGVIAAHTVLPVIGVPLATSVLAGVDSLLAMVQMPSGVPVATVGVNGSKNAAFLALSILALGDESVKAKLLDYRKKMAEEVLESNNP